MKLRPLLIVFGVFCILCLEGIWFPPPAEATVYSTSGTKDSCGKLTIQTTEAPSCTRLSQQQKQYAACAVPNPNQTNTVASYSINVSVTSADGKSHSFSYAYQNNSCDHGYLSYSNNDGYCDCGQYGGTSYASASTPTTVTVSASPGKGANCGSYQLDFNVLSVDGNTSCTFGGNGLAGSVGVCETGIECTAAPTSTPTPTPTPVPTYTITGSVFVDTNQNGIRDGGESTYTGGITIQAPGGTVTTKADGTYTITGLRAGSTTVSYTSLPSGYFLVAPKNGPPPSYLVTVGPGCLVSPANGATCDGAGNITGLNFAISNTWPWLQLTDLDGRIDSGFTNPVPATAACSTNAIITDAKATQPGVIYSGDTTADFGAGQASTTNWVVGSSTYPEVFTQAAQGSLATSFTVLRSKATRAGLPLTDLTSIAGCSNLSNCTLPPTLSDGLYLASGDVQLNGITFPTGKNYVFLVNGNLILAGKVVVPVGSTALFSASGSITIASSVGAPADSCPAPSGQIQGMYSADKNIIVAGKNNCQQGPDTMVNIEGNMIANAAGAGGAWMTQRNLCSDNASYPAVTVTARPDFLLNAPTFLLQQRVVSQEEVP